MLPYPLTASRNIFISFRYQESAQPITLLFGKYSVRDERENMAITSYQTMPYENPANHISCDGLVVLNLSWIMG
jgi:hypothetical protein